MPSCDSSRFLLFDSVVRESKWIFISSTEESTDRAKSVQLSPTPAITLRPPDVHPLTNEDIQMFSR
ncbi:hypothetical protein INR49_020456 [Caranx melampygus]|nr:hypothetical protein INR49_020456 [Caranx melampygus]